MRQKLEPAKAQQKRRVQRLNQKQPAQSQATKQLLQQQQWLARYCEGWIE